MANINHKNLTEDDWHDQDTLTDNAASETKVEVDTGVAGEVKVTSAGSDAMVVTDTAVVPGVDSTSSCGSASKAWADVHTDQLTLGATTPVTSISNDITDDPADSHASLASAESIWDKIDAIDRDVYNFASNNTKLIMRQSSCPTGWSLDTEDLQTATLRVCNDGTTGTGTVAPSPAFSSTVTAGTGDITTGLDSVPQHQHADDIDTTNESAHTHTVITPYNTSSGGGGDNINLFSSVANSVISTLTTAGGSAHKHTMIGSVGNVTGATVENWIPKYIDVIVAQKDT